MLVLLLLCLIIVTPYVIRTYNSSTELRDSVQAALGDLSVALDGRTSILKITADQITEGDSFEISFQKQILALRKGVSVSKLDTSLTQPMVALAENYPTPASIQLRRDLGGAVQEVEAVIQTKVERCNAAIEAYNTFVAAIPAIIVLFPLGRRRLDFITSASAEVHRNKI